MKRVRELDISRHTGTAELWQRGDEYLYISTVDLNKVMADPFNQAIGSLSEMLCGTAVEGEETMAFLASAEGEPFDMADPVAVANGPDSRTTVLRELGHAGDTS